MKRKIINEWTLGRGFTLIELVIYAALIMVVSGVIVAFVIQIINVTETSRRGRESLDNAKRSVDLISQEIRHATGVYIPTVVAGANPGQLSLETSRDIPTDEESTYVDIYVDDERLFIKREGQSELIVTSQKVIVTELIFTILQDSNQRQSVRTQITVRYVDPISGPTNDVSLVSTVELRSF